MRIAIGVGVVLGLVALSIAVAAPRTPAKTKVAATKSAKGKTTMVQVHVFNKEGKLVGPVDSPKVVLNDREWRELLTPDQYQVLRSSGTERPFCGTLLDNKIDGVYTCAGCGLPQFASDAKFQSGTGWPSFFQPVSKTNIAEHIDRSHGMLRNEINCARCDGHLGHVFDDGPRPTGLRFCMNSASLNFTASDQLASLADPAADPEEKGATLKNVSMQKEKETTVLAGGCFWCTEAAFDQLQGVLDVESGYTGGAKATANYQAVCTGQTGHAEAIRVTYDPSKISHDKLLDVFFDAHDPTTLNAQGADQGTQYRSAIFFKDEKEKAAAEAKIEELTKKHAFNRKIVTSLEPLGEFYPAEDYHQDYARINPLQPYIQAQSYPKVCKIRKKHADIVKPEK
jgi:peptide methionine sulfoxide reductase msrA/msrB